MPLSMVNPGQNAILNSIRWGPKLKKKLQDMGLTPGVEINVISNNTNGAFIINVRGSRLVLGGVVTQQIMVDLA
ncbi:FeoA family protein [Crassaminicella indica]|uniref:Ferrous iron transport protein A n=1 Tax=Crassaminicella indica TaxID=2855394 RepID=A0ABX8RCQ9_9CLOT|nr:FeoA family protein [Crassaminicella indica]QXM06840.1 ferrous iron transport protein A [Crassaminicella indica]